MRLHRVDLVWLHLSFNKNTCLGVLPIAGGPHFFKLSASGLRVFWGLRWRRLLKSTVAPPAWAHPSGAPEAMWLDLQASPQELELPLSPPPPLPVDTFNQGWCGGSDSDSFLLVQATSPYSIAYLTLDDAPTLESVSSSALSLNASTRKEQSL